MFRLGVNLSSSSVVMCLSSSLWTPESMWAVQPNSIRAPSTTRRSAIPTAMSCSTPDRFRNSSSPKITIPTVPKKVSCPRAANTPTSKGLGAVPSNLPSSRSSSSLTPRLRQ